MQVQIAGKKIAIGAALQERIALGLEDRVSKYFDRTGEAFVTVSKPGWAFNVDCSVHLPSGVTLQAHGEGDDAYAAFEASLDKIEKRVRRYKSRLRNHRAKDPLPIEMAAERIIQLAPDVDGEDVDGFDLDGEDPDGAQVDSDGVSPAIVAESDTAIRTMTVSMAVMQLELGDSPALMFRNAAHGGLNMVFRRPDGNVGWVDPAKEA
jgi:ribosomal subunit interface protein